MNKITLSATSRETVSNKINFEQWKNLSGKIGLDYFPPNYFCTNIHLFLHVHAFNTILRINQVFASLTKLETIHMLPLLQVT